ncbi:MAG TPA: NADPH:quinone reductase [Vicinamibacterales bacterium]|nr:NADPH:quinone reductase [Vicinamibacterales bacterium]
MKAIVVREHGGPEVLKLEDVPDPKPNADQVVVRLHAVGVNPVDVYIRTGAYARKPALPFIPGSDAGGEIESVGANVKKYKPGDRVFIHGTAADHTHGHYGGAYAQKAVCNLDHVYRLPVNVSFAQGAAMGVPYATAYRALFHRAQMKPGETVLIHGATGGVGIAATQIAHADGITVLGTGGSDTGLQSVRASGADAVFNHTQAGYLDEILKATGGRGVDVILEMATHINLDKDLGLLANRGRVVVIGNRGRVEIDARQTMAKDAAILGMTLFNISDADMASINAYMMAGLENGSLKPVVGREFPLADAAKAQDAVMASGAHGKIVLTS